MIPGMLKDQRKQTIQSKVTVLTKNTPHAVLHSIKFYTFTTCIKIIL